jgi:hypothetical protein
MQGLTQFTSQASFSLKVLEDVLQQNKSVKPRPGSCGIQNRMVNPGRPQVTAGHRQLIKIGDGGQ